LTILALDTTSEFGSVALRRGDQIVAERILHSADGFAHVLFQAISELLRTAYIALEEIDIFAAASGPGSFTGVRVGLAAVKGLAAAEGKRAYGISTLRALCCFATGDNRAAILDARRGEVFAGIYNRNLHAVVPEMVGPLPSWLARLSASVDEFVIFAGSPFAGALQGHRCTEAPRNLAGAVGLCAARDAQDGLSGDPAALDANYVRRPDAELLLAPS
jgi:tRNA threonylcarbamoyladenosine biosynthesis protein TsaB